MTTMRTNEKKKRVVIFRKPISISQSRVSLKDPIIERSASSSPPPSPPPKVDKKLTASRVERQDWPLDEVDSSSYCHQCRRKTFYAKMTCTDCEKKFCVRCYAFQYALFSFFGFYIYNLEAEFVCVRYPECEFDTDDDEYSCPACEGFCNCTVCCLKRGEAHVGTRRCDKHYPPPPTQRPARVKLGAKTNLPPPTSSSSRAKIKTTTIPKRATNAWGSLYNIYFIRW